MFGVYPTMWPPLVCPWLVGRGFRGFPLSQMEWIVHTPHNFSSQVAVLVNTNLAVLPSHPSQAHPEPEASPQSQVLVELVMGGTRVCARGFKPSAVASTMV